MRLLLWHDSSLHWGHLTAQLSDQRSGFSVLGMSKQNIQRNSSFFCTSKTIINGEFRMHQNKAVLSYRCFWAPWLLFAQGCTSESIFVKNFLLPRSKCLNSGGTKWSHSFFRKLTFDWLKNTHNLQLRLGCQYPLTVHIMGPSVKVSSELNAGRYLTGVRDQT